MAGNRISGLNSQSLIVKQHVVMTTAKMDRVRKWRKKKGEKRRTGIKIKQHSGKFNKNEFALCLVALEQNITIHLQVIFQFLLRAESFKYFPGMHFFSFCPFTPHVYITQQ